ncbi:Pyridoxal phosphate-dependent decarboxylase [Dillenia turbinata]|uniref:Pyridoxal phosphate-dependent decarboxylase n=1 Tax=Dillenia turbinata TaxID=194707 RepID=A0AAN8VUP4_9MAGN
MPFVFERTGLLLCCTRILFEVNTDFTLQKIILANLHGSWCSYTIVVYNARVSLKQIFNFWWSCKGYKASESNLVVDYKDWQIPLGRQFRSLKLWMVLQLYSLENLQCYIKNHIKLARHFEELVMQDTRFEVNMLVPEPSEETISLASVVILTVNSIVLVLKKWRSENLILPTLLIVSEFHDSLSEVHTAFCSRHSTDRRKTRRCGMKLFVDSQHGDHNPWSVGPKIQMPNETLTWPEEEPSIK